MDPVRLELTTSCLQSRCSSQVNYGPVQINIIIFCQMFNKNIKILSKWVLAVDYPSNRLYSVQLSTDRSHPDSDRSIHAYHLRLLVYNSRTAIYGTLNFLWPTTGFEPVSGNTTAHLRFYVISRSYLCPC